MIAKDRVSQRGAVGSDLVSPAGVNAGGKPAMGTEFGEACEVCSGGFSTYRVWYRPVTAVTVGQERELEPQIRPCWFPFDDCQVVLLNLTAFELLVQRSMCNARSCQDHQPACPAIQAVYDPQAAEMWFEHRT
jgi:hypothetical protein